MKVIIAGSRDFDNYALLRKTMLGPVKEVGIEPTVIVSGTAKGADKLGEDFSHEMDLIVVSFPADWDKHGRSAGYIRNAEMAKYADALVAFWDGESRGTKNMIEQAKKRNLKVFVEIYKNE